MSVGLESKTADYSATYFDLIADFEADFTTGSARANTGGLIRCDRATAARYIDADGMSKVAEPGTPRFKRNPISGQILGLMTEPAATNVLPFNGDLTQISTYIPLNVDVASSVEVIGIDGNGMFHLTEKISDTAVYHALNTPFYACDANGYLSASIYAKAGERNYIDVEIGFKPQSTGFKVVVSLTDGTYSVTSGNRVPGFVSVERHINNIYRINLTAQAKTAASTGNLSILTSTGAAISYVGTAGYGIYIQRPQIESSPRCTSPIDTGALAATRDADNCYYPASVVAPLLNAGYTAFVEAVVTQQTSATYAAGEVSPAALCLRKSNVAVMLLGRQTSSLLPYLFSRKPSGEYIVSSGNPEWKTGAMKLAGTSDGSFAWDGNAVTKSDVAVQTADTLQVGSALQSKEYLEGYIKSVRIYTRPLPAEVLKRITTR